MKTTDKRFIRALKGETLIPPPFWLMRQAGRYLSEYMETRGAAGGFLDLCYTPELATEVTLQPLRRYGMDAAILFSDILVVPDALGQSVSFEKGEGPKLKPLKDEADLEALGLDHFHRHLAPVYETVARLSKAIPETTALIGFCGAPWTVATYMIEGGGSKDYSLTKTWAYGKPDLFAKVIDLLVESTAAYLIRQVENGAEALQIFDSWAGVLPETEFDQWVTKPISRIIERVRDAHPGVPIIAFPRGAGPLYETFVDRTKVDCIGLDTTVPVEWAAEKLQTKCCVQGNLDPIMLVAGGEKMLAETDRILKALGKGPFVFNLGHGIVPQTPPENVALLAERIRAFRG